MRSFFIKFRGEDHEVEYQDHGYESDTNAHDIDWNFAAEDMKDVTTTDEEDQDIYNQIYEKIWESRMCDEPEL